MKRLTATLAVLLIVSANVWAGMDDDVARIRQQWERIRYQVDPKEQEAAFEALVKDAAKIMAQYPNQAEPAIWHGIAESSYAGAKGGLGALAIVRNARKSLEQALAINPKALDGSAYTSLGALYYQVPGWPVGFGDYKKALELLQKGLALNPNGIDPNYFLGDLLYRSGDYAGSEQSLRKAMQAPPREGRKIADEGRRKEINDLMDKVREKQR